MAAPKTYAQFLEGVSPPWALGQVSGGYYGVTLALSANLVAEGMRRAVLMAWLAEVESPDDALPLAGSEVRLPRYPNETADAYRARILGAWELYDYAGTPAGINAQIAAAGLNGTVLFQPAHPGPGPDFAAPYWSQFWIQTSETSDAAINTITAIARKWKPVQWRLRGLILEIDPMQAQAIADPAIGEDAISA